MPATFRRALCALVLVSIASTSVAADYGRTQGAFGVSGGSANYSIPIWTPPGPNGVQPSISLNYNSQGGNGVGGVGWHLAAVSSIERCARTQYQDGYAAAVDLTTSPRFCLGGNRLRLQSGAYGAANSVYFTEIADYSRITAYGTTGNGPQYFVVEAKSGLKYEYGATSNSQVLLNSTVLRWMLNKVYDRSGNNYVVSYNSATGFAVPDVISWTPTYLGSSSYRYQAKFNYLPTRSDEDSFLGKVAGLDVANRYRLENIQIKSAGTVVRKYVFGYDTSPATSRSRLTSAKECANDDDPPTNCLLPLTFTYQAGQAGVGSTGTSGLASSSSVVRGKYDFNGDGKSDLLQVTGGTWRVAFATGSGFSAPLDTGVSSSATFHIHRFLATHQDGLLVDVSGVWHYVGYNGSMFTSASTVTPVPASTVAGTETKVTDNNGDGIADLVWTVGGDVKVRLNTSTAASTTPSFGAESTAISFSVGQGNVGIINAQNCPIERNCDVNGDTRSDLIVNVVSVTGCGIAGCSVSNNVYDLLSSAGGYIAGPPAGPIGYTGIMFNDDRCIDRIQNSSTTLQVSGCNDGAPTALTIPAAPELVLDWNGDGNGDLLVNNGGFFGVYLSKGNAASPFTALVSTTVPYSSSCLYFAFDPDGDGFDDIGCVGAASPFAVSYYPHNGSGGVYLTQQPDLLSSVTDGYGVTTSPSYVSTSQNNYTRGTATQLPLVDETDPLTVVAQVTSSNGIDGTYTKTYSYVGARSNRARGESAGFHRIDEVDSRNAIISRTYFDQTFPLAGMVSQQEVMQPNGVTPISRTVYANSFEILSPAATNQRYFIYPSASTATQYEVGGIWNGNLLRAVTTSNLYDYTSGLLYDQTVTTGEPVSGANGVTTGGEWKSRTHMPIANVLNDTANWCLGRPGKVQQTNSHNLPYGTSVTRNTDITWSAAYCRPTFHYSEFATPLQVTTAIFYDDFGNVIERHVTGHGMGLRSTEALYFDEAHKTGQFPISATNALNQTSTSEWDYDLGLPNSATDPNGISVSWDYDAFGRRTRENHPDGTYTTWEYLPCHAGCDSRARMYVERNERLASGAAFSQSLQYFDQFDRSIYEYAMRSDGLFDITRRNFDALGRVAHEYFPYSSGASEVGYTTFNYDLVSRPTSISRPESDSISAAQSMSFSYEGLSTRFTDLLNKETIRTVSANGALIRSIDESDYYQQFDYEAFGNVARVTDQAGNTLQSSIYNNRGMLTSRFDMDMGSWTFTPNALGETVSQTDAKSQPTTFEFDLLGRLKKRIEPEGTSEWTWDSLGAEVSIGQLSSVSGPGYSETYLYDSFGRPQTTTVSADQTYQFDYSYNEFGLLETLTYPTSTSGYRLKLLYGYQQGHLYRISDYNVPEDGFWVGYAANARGQHTEEWFGNGLKTHRAYDAVTGTLKSIQTGLGGSSAVQSLEYKWDLVGNLKKRIDLNQSSLTEEFFYDNLHRLDYSQRNGVTNLDMTYDAMGNITNKSDVGSYIYHATKKHQVVSTSNGWSFGYDGNGNMTSGRGRNISWTSYNYPLCVTSGTDCTGTTADYAQFSYTPNRQYWKQQSNFTTGGAATTIYVGGLLEKVTTSTGTDYRHMIRAGGASIIVSRRTAGPNPNNTYYVTSDHLGSASAVTNGSGGALVQESFDAFGKRRGSDWAGSPSGADWTAIASTTRRGYTDHSMLDNLNLIHMNGRVQDSVLGRFASADPYITEPGNTQNYNRYSYVYNSPLSLTDPSGYLARWSFSIPACTDGCARVVARGIVERSNRGGGAGGGPAPRPPAGTDGGGAGDSAVTGNNTPQGETPSSIGKCFVQGAATGAVGTVAVGALAVGAVVLGAPVAAVTATLGAVAIVGGVIFGIDIAGNIRSGNWGGLAFNMGSLFGGAGAGRIGGRAIAEGINGVRSPSWSWRSDASQGYNRGLGSPRDWLATGPNPASAGFSAASGGVGGAQPAQQGCN
jgi:RHS repeat-associated protein